MKARKRQPLDFSVLPTEPLAAETPAAASPEAAPETAPDLDMAIVEAPAAETPVVQPEVETAPAASAPPPPPVEPVASAFRLDTRPEPASGGGLFWFAAWAVAAIWSVTPIAFTLGWRQSSGPFAFDGFTLGLLLLLGVGSAAFVLLAAYLLRQGMRLASEARRARQMADQLLSPAALAASGASDVVAAVRLQIEHANAAAAEARERMLALREALAVETERLAEAAATSARTASHLAENLGRERESMTTLSQTLDGQASSVTDAIARQARMVAEASDLAEAQLREAEAALAARAADMAAAAGEANTAARTTADDLSRQIARLETAGIGVGEQLRAVELALTNQRTALVDAAQGLRADQEDFAAETETRTAQLSEFVGHTRQSAGELNEISTRAAETLTGLIASTTEQFRQIAESAKEEREALGIEAGRSLGAVAEAAASERARLEQQLSGAFEGLSSAAEQARKAADQHADAAMARVDQLNEAAFAAGQKADAIFEARLNDARELIEQSALMVEQAGARTAQKLEDGVGRARHTLGELEALMAEVADRVRGLPDDALQQAEAVKLAVERGVGELLSAARQAAEETQAIDAAFQARVRRNYDILNEAASRVSSTPPAAPRQSAPTPAPVAAPPAPKARAALPEAVPEPGGLRPRLRLTPTATDEEFRSVFGAAGGPKEEVAPEPQGDRGDWSWKDLLSTIDDGSADDQRLGEKLHGEITGMGIDPTALLPQSRLDDIAEVLKTGDRAGAREMVKKLAPAATRRLVRRLFSDTALRTQVDRFLRRQAAMIDEAVEQDRGGFLVGALVASEVGRAYLLLEAAAGDLA
ncbi:polar localization protein TipN [Caulobacter segnis]|uniref:polar localization protein TipN n=1 Tax=Caulobacter segnis TaxID=88688 RepID=UPI00240F0AF6|nr:polar localization protein TipN [Caulobacter segnis]MDG2522280.1 polar localization protein TipN [Caulobacter segnis]